MSYTEAERVIYRSAGGKVEIATNIPGFKWPTPTEKIDGLLSAGLIDEAEAERLRAFVLEQSSAHRPNDGTGEPQ